MGNRKPERHIEWMAASRWYRFTTALLGLMMVLGSPLSVVSQDDIRREYESSLEQWKNTYLDLIQVWNEFKICEEHEADALRDEYLSLKEKGDALAEQTIHLAADVLLNSQSPDVEIIALLEELPYEFYEVADYGRSAHVGRALLKHDSTDLGLLLQTAKSAFFNNEFESARKWLSQFIKQEGSLPEEFQVLYDLAPSMNEAWEEEQALRAKEEESAHLPRLAFETNKGTIVVELFEDQAPVVVNNLIALSESSRPYFDNLLFFMVLPHQFAVTGCQAGDGSRVAPIGLSNEENQAKARQHFRGSFTLDIVEFNNAIIAACRFCRIPMPDMAESSLVVGRIVEGMEVVDNLAATHQLNRINKPVPIEDAAPDRVLSVSLVRNPSGKEYRFKSYENTNNSKTDNEN